MKILGIDTATGLASVAILDDERVLAEQRSDTAGHRADLLVLVDAVARQAGVTPRELDGIAIGAGPGSFTGLRIGMATAKGIAFAAGRPLWAVSSLAALAQPELEALAATTGTTGASVEMAPAVVGVLDARRGEVYAGAYRLVDGKVTLVGDERVLPPRDLAAFAPPGARFVGDAAAAYPELAQLPGTWGTTPSGVAVARLALAGAHVDVLVTGAPTYIRPSEAEVRYPDGVPGALRKR